MDKLYPEIDARRTGERIRYLMKSNNISARQLQEYLGLTCVQSVYRWLNGTNIPTVDNLYALGVLFCVSIDDILCGNREEIRFFNKMENRLLFYYNYFKAHFVDMSKTLNLF